MKDCGIDILWYLLKLTIQIYLIPIGNEDEHKKERIVALKGSLQQSIQNEIKGR